MRSSGHPANLVAEKYKRRIVDKKNVETSKNRFSRSARSNQTTPISRNPALPQL
jgi:hypothetical protein